MTPSFASGLKRVASQQIPRRVSHAKKMKAPSVRGFNYSLDFKATDFRKQAELYRVGIGERGVLLVEPYKAEILPHWKFARVELAKVSATKISSMFEQYRQRQDFVGMDMARKFLQMGFTRSRRYANHPSGRKYALDGRVLPFGFDEEKAKSAEIFRKAWHKVEADEQYQDLKAHWRSAFG